MERRLTPQEQIVLELFENQLYFEEVIAKSGLSKDMVNVVLECLEAKGWIREV